jgi:hypothetical protein
VEVNDAATVVAAHADPDIERWHDMHLHGQVNDRAAGQA